MPEATDGLNEYQRAAQVARFVELQDVSLVSVDSKLLVTKQQFLSGAAAVLETTHSATYEFAAETNSLIVFVSLNAGLSEERGDQTKPLVLRVSASFRLEYAFRAKGGPAENERDLFFGAFANVNGTYNVWPYFRELVQSLTGRMGLPPIVIPVFRALPQSKPVHPSQSSTDLKSVAGQR